MNFLDQLDTIFCVQQEMVENRGEDSYYCAIDKESAIISVYDGCGGLGARSYKSFKGKTGAYIAARALSGAVHDWFHKNSSNSWSSSKELLGNMNSYITKAYKVCSKYAVDKLRIRGSMVRDLPSTMAVAYTQYKDIGIVLHIIWAGDSRIYLMNEEGIAQLTIDDLDIQDAMDNLLEDAVLTNILSSDGNYKLHYKQMIIKKPTIILAATDGCFGYIPSPMEYELLILECMMRANSVQEYKKELYQKFLEWTSDDFAFGFMSILYGSYENTKECLKKRYKYLVHMRETFFENDIRIEANVKNFWKKYKVNYERYL